MSKKIVKSRKNLVYVGTIQSKIYWIRGHKIMLDIDLAELYGVLTKRLNEQVKRNIKRFPEDFMFQLTSEEKDELVANCDQLSKHSSSNPYAFTEQGIAMLSSVLNSDRAIEVNIQIIRVFVKLKELMLSHKGLAQKIEDLERRFQDHDKKFVMVFDAIKQLLKAKEQPASSDYKKTKIGFIVDP